MKNKEGVPHEDIEEMIEGERKKIDTFKIYEYVSRVQKNGRS